MLYIQVNASTGLIFFHLPYLFHSKPLHNTPSLHYLWCPPCFNIHNSLENANHSPELRLLTLNLCKRNLLPFCGLRQILLLRDEPHLILLYTVSQFSTWCPTLEMYLPDRYFYDRNNTTKWIRGNFMGVDNYSAFQHYMQITFLNISSGWMHALSRFFFNKIVAALTCATVCNVTFLHSNKQLTTILVIRLLLHHSTLYVIWTVKHFWVTLRRRTLLKCFMK